MRRVLLLFVLFFSSFTLYAQEELLKIRGEVRVDYRREYNRHRLDDENSGFFGSFINLQLDGGFAEKFTYSYRQRLNKTIVNKSFFDATDWLYLSYNHNERWNLAAGKLVVAIGGWEYDKSPIDLYSCSEFWNNIACYQFGVEYGYRTGNGNDRFVAQIVQSPFHIDENRDMYGYGVAWYGNHGPFRTIYSANMFEYEAGKYISYISLGHKVEFEKFYLLFDFMNRADNHHTFLFDDVSLVGVASFTPIKSLNIFAKVTYDVNRSGCPSDMTIYDGTEITMLGMGAEFYPLKENRNLRLHANYFHSFGSDTNPSATMYDNRRIFNAGLTWKLDLFKIKR